jgi:hypothetical protein
MFFARIRVPLLFASLVAGAYALGCSSNKAASTNDPAPNDGDSSTDDGSASSDGGVDPDADPLAACRGISLAQNGTWDVDLEAVHVKGAVSLNGAPGPSDDVRISFVDSKTKTVASVIVDDAGNYQTTIAPGAYDVWYEAPSKTCAPTREWPCVRHRLKTAATLSADGVLDLDVKTAKVSGQITVNGTTFPAAGAFAIAFTDATFPIGDAPGTATAAIDQGTDGAKYAATLAPGRYTVSFVPPYSCTAKSTVPCSGGVLKAGASVTSSGVLDLDVPMVIVKGAVTLNGAAMPKTSSLGAITFGRDAQSTIAATSVNLDANGSYSIPLFSDVYDVAYSGVANADSTSPLPRNGGKLKAGVALTHSGTLDLDLPTASVQGKVTVNGAALPASGATGSIVFSGHGSTPVSAAIAEGSYKINVLAGAYDVLFQGSGNACTGTTTGALPCNGGRLESLTLAKGKGVLDVDVPAFTLTGNVTVAKAALGDTDSAYLTFIETGAAAAGALSVPTTGSYEVSLFGGTMTSDSAAEAATRTGACLATVA